jgi:hypothetical protein
MVKVDPAALTRMGSLPFIEAGFGLLFIRLSDRLFTVSCPSLGAPGTSSWNLNILQFGF